MFNEEGIAQTNLFTPTPGYTVVTTLDSRLQEMAIRVAQRYGELHDTVHASIIIKNPNTGEILAMAEHPTFDSSDPFNINFANGSRMRDALYNASEEERLNLFFNLWANYNISSSFEPGSVLKALSGAAALEEGIVCPNEVFFCGGSHHVAGETIICWIYPGAHGSLTVAQAMATSCNVVFMQLGTRLGRARMYSYLNDFGVGSLTGIDLLGEADVRALTYTYRQLNPVEVATSAMGQGFNMTPIQLVTSFSAVINGGHMLRPFIVSRVVDPRENNRIVYENEPTVIRNVISESTSEFWRREMVQVLESSIGTGRDAVIGGFSIGGKTGTGQQGDRAGNEIVQSFIGYLPADNPRYLVMVSLNRPGQGESRSVPIAHMLRTVMQYLISITNITHTGYDGEPNDAIALIEDYTGMTFSTAMRRIIDKGLTPTSHGIGTTIVAQSPAPWDSVPVGSTVMLYLSLDEDDEEQELVLVPDLQYLPVEQALEMLYYLELDYNLIFSGNDDDDDEEIEEIDEEQIVLAQMPNAGSFVPAQTEIMLFVNFLDS